MNLCPVFNDKHMRLASPKHARELRGHFIRELGGAYYIRSNRSVPVANNPFDGPGLRWGFGGLVSELPFSVVALNSPYLERTGGGQVCSSVADLPSSSVLRNIFSIASLHFNYVKKFRNDKRRR
jgi:hypothetical protein